MNHEPDLNNKDSEQYSFFEKINKFLSEYIWVS